MKPILTPWRTITEPNVYGITRGATNGRRVEVIRANASDWRLFAFEDDKPVRDTGERSQFGDRGGAMLAGSRWLRSPALTPADIATASDPRA